MLHELTPGPGGKVLCSYCNAQRPIQNTLEIDTGAFFPTTICEDCYAAQRHHHNPPTQREKVRPLKKSRCR